MGSYGQTLGGDRRFLEQRTEEDMRGTGGRDCGMGPLACLPEGQTQAMHEMRIYR